VSAREYTLARLIFYVGVAESSIFSILLYGTLVGLFDSSAALAGAAAQRSSRGHRNMLQLKTARCNIAQHIATMQSKFHHGTDTLQGRPRRLRRCFSAWRPQRSSCRSAGPTRSSCLSVSSSPRRPPPALPSASSRPAARSAPPSTAPGRIRRFALIMSATANGIRVIL
jgi:hypothetical protein